MGFLGWMKLSWKLVNSIFEANYLGNNFILLNASKSHSNRTFISDFVEIFEFPSKTWGGGASKAASNLEACVFCS